ncbi:TOM1-like protein 2 [Galdieria sulphuraria]|uniref:VHS domain-containing protein n=1 Tax=Galdieria sulphuraria TaxID=130081 RepID=M2W040_GALSU|nr:uncharacterized protein Gasu_35500 [Galdieria sulphuraria]EME28976.1 hypothetical protein Gasu_35500 [Galdieria sulphuraria]GJD06913.1 TOM1-like protein 2 [Galdieria sulphuraria]|eukprot:XP_005705496.1 hypothetical protein Gasu_35500 [Galdieria sulphuraria]
MSSASPTKTPREDKLRKSSALAMSKVSGMFRAITPKSELESTILKATASSLKEPNWKLNMKVCDLIKKEAPSSSNLQEIVRYICKRVKHPDEKVALNALVLLETTVKNGKPVYYKAVADRGIPKLLKVVYNPLTSQDVRNRILQLIDIWADAFQPVEDSMPQFKEAYQELLKRGFDFPPRTNESLVPVIQVEEDPELAATLASSRAEASSSVDTDHSIPSLQYSPSSSSSRELERLHDELKETTGIVRLFEETVSFIKPETEDPSEVELARELYEKVSTLHERLSSLLENISDESIINKCLTLNDFILQVLAEYESKVSIHQSMVDSAKSSTETKSSQNPSEDVSKASNHEDDAAKSVPAWLKASVPVSSSSADWLRNHSNASNNQSVESKVTDVSTTSDQRMNNEVSNYSNLNNSSPTDSNSGTDNVDLIGLSEEKNIKPSTARKEISTSKNETSDPFDELFAPTVVNSEQSHSSKKLASSFADLLIEDEN